MHIKWWGHNNRKQFASAHEHWYNFGCDIPYWIGERSNSITERSNCIGELFNSIRELTKSFALLCNWIREHFNSIKELSNKANKLESQIDINSINKRALQLIRELN